MRKNSGIYMYEESMLQKLGAILVLLMILGSFEMPFSFVFYETGPSSTYGGRIAEDTTWTPAQSPYIITTDCSVDSGITLTVEPGVVVKFGTGLSLTVYGSLRAMGTESNPITFTSNRPQPAAGDWSTIRFTAAPSESLTMRYCVVEYAVNGITVYHTVARVIVESSYLSNNSHSGMHIGDPSNVLVRASSLMFNGAHGISITGLATSGVTLIDNNISFNNGKGINLLTESYSPTMPGYISNLTFSGNLISFNKNNGIRLFKYATIDAFVNEITISDNNISSNGEDGLQIFSSGTIFDVRVSGNNVSYNDGNGINLEVSSFSDDSAIYNSDVSGNIVSFNSKSGIYVHVRDQGDEGSIHDVTVLDNIVLSNMDGISLSARKHLEEEVFDTLAGGNSVSANSHRGIFVLGNIRTNVTANSISYNGYGVFYEESADNVANHNDIYNNSHGMIVSDGATVNAEHNYWGDTTGPYHELQNPGGNGNPINGNGTDLDFEPFLSTPIGPINKRPVANLMLNRKIATVNEIVTFDGSASSDDGRVYKYLFDFKDGFNSGWTTLSTVTHSYIRVGIYNVSLMVMDEYTVTSENVEIEVISIMDQLPSLTVSVEAGPDTVQPGENSTISVYVTDGESPIDGTAISLSSNKGGAFSPETGHTDINGQFTCIFTAPLITQRIECIITVNATKAEYLGGQDQVTVVILNEGGLDVWTFLWSNSWILVGILGVVLLFLVVVARKRSRKT